MLIQTCQFQLHQALLSNLLLQKITQHPLTNQGRIFNSTMVLNRLVDHIEKHVKCNLIPPKHFKYFNINIQYGIGAHLGNNDHVQ